MTTKELLQLRRLAQLHGVKAPAADDAIPGNVAPPPVQEPESLMDKIYGAGEVASSAVTGTAAAMAEPFVGRKNADAIQGPGPQTQAGKRYAGNVNAAMEATGLNALPPVMGVHAPHLAAPVARAGVAGAAGAVGKVADVAAPEIGAVKNAASKAKLALTPEIAPDTAALARKAQELGIDIRPDMLTNNKFARMIGEALEKVPLSGSTAERRQQVFNRAIMATIGADGPQHRLTPDVFDRAFEKAGKTIGDISERTPVPLDANFQQSLASHLANTSTETADVTKIIGAYVKEIHDAAENGVIPGTAFRKINSKLGKQIRGADSGDLRRALGDLQDDMQEALSGQLRGGDLEILQDARKKYAISNKLIPLVAKSPKGDISPAGLMQAVTLDKSAKRAMARGKGGDIGELAKIGQMFLKEPGTSNTTERGLAYSIMGGGALAEPTTTGAIYGAANLYNRWGPSLSRRLTGVKQSDVDRAKLGYKP